MTNTYPLVWIFFFAGCATVNIDIPTSEGESLDCQVDQQAFVVDIKCKKLEKGRR